MKERYVEEEPTQSAKASSNEGKPKKKNSTERRGEGRNAQKPRLDVLPGHSMQPSEIGVGQLLECRGREVQCVTDTSSAGVGDADSDAVAFVACVHLLVADGVLVRVAVGAGIGLEGPDRECSNVVAVLVDSSAGVQASAVERSVTSVRLSTAAVAIVIVVVSRRLGLLSSGGSAMSGVLRRSWVGLLGGGGVGLFGSGGSRFVGQNASGRDGSD